MSSVCSVLSDFVLKSIIFSLKQVASHCSNTSGSGVRHFAASFECGSRVLVVTDADQTAGGLG
jgi:hypothetical protein